MSDRRSAFRGHGHCSPRGRGRRRHGFSEILSTETVGGARLLAASATALVWANSPWSAAYDMVGDVQVGADNLGLIWSQG